MTPDEVARAVRALIAQEGFSPGERIGDERTLAAKLQISRTALRAGLDRLTQEGAVRRTIGRSGGVLATDGRLERHLNTVESLPEIARRQGVLVLTQLLRIELGLATPGERRRLRLADGAAVHRLLRLRVADGRPLSLEESSLPADLFPALDREDLSSLYGTLRERYGIGPVFSDETVQVVPADPARAAHLEVEPGTALLHVNRVATGSTGRPVELGDEWFVADRVRFHLRTYGYVKQQARSTGARRPAAPRSAPSHVTRRPVATAPLGGLL
jgi:GntR family transcriptional regulator